MYIVLWSLIVICWLWCGVFSVHFVVGNTVCWLKWHLHRRKAFSLSFFLYRCVCVSPAVCAAECNVQRAFCKIMYTDPPGRVSFYAYCKTLQKITCHRILAFLQFVFSLVQLLAVFVFASRAAYKNQHFGVFRV